MLNDSTSSSSTAKMNVKMQPPSFKITMVSWNMANKSAGDINKLMSTIINQNNGQLPDMIVIATQEEGLGGQLLCDEIDTIYVGDKPRYMNTRAFETMTKPGERGRVSLTVLSRPGSTQKLEWVTVQQEGNSNKGGIGCRVGVNGHYFSFSGMHLDSNHDSSKVKVAAAMVGKLEDMGENNYLTFDMMKNRSTECDVMMGDLNHRLVEVKKAAPYDPLGNPKEKHANFKESAARYFHALSFSPARDVNETKGMQAENTYKKKKKTNRVDGATGEACLSEGGLDKFLLSAPPDTLITPVTVVDSDASDHMAIVSTMAITKVTSEFERTRDWVIRKIETFASKEVIENLRDLKDNNNDQLHLEIVFNYYKCVRDFILQAEEFRLQETSLFHFSKVPEYNFLMGGTGGKKDLGFRKTFEESLKDSASQPDKQKGLVQQMIEKGNDIFKDTHYLNDPATISDKLKIEPKANNKVKKFSKTSYEKVENITAAISESVKKFTPQAHVQPESKLEVKLQVSDVSHAAQHAKH